jgi:hypothetical protein
MTLPLDGTLGSLVGRLDVLRIECLTCGRFGRYTVARLLEKHGASYRLTDWAARTDARLPKQATDWRHFQQRKRLVVREAS